MNRLRIAGRLVEPSLNRIDGAQIEPKVMQVLAVLASRCGEVVTREELMTAVWAGVFVTDDVLNRAIREIRRVFADDAENPRVVETIRKRGYRLVAPVEPAAPEVQATIPAADSVAWTPGPLVIAAMLIVATAAGALLVRLGIGRGGSIATEAHMRFVPLTSDPGNEVEPALSPDGRRLAYVARASDGRPRIFIKNTGGGTPVQLTRGDGHDVAPAWSADGTFLAYAHIVDLPDPQRRATPGPKGPGLQTAASDATPDPKGPGLQTAVSDATPDPKGPGLQTAARQAVASARPGLQKCVIRVIDQHGTSTRDVGPCGWRDSLKMSWSPDGRTLAIAERAGCGAGPEGCHAVPSRIALLDVAAGTRRPLTEPPAGTIGDDSPAFAPDGRRIAFLRSISGAIGDIFIVGTSGGPPVRVTHDNSDVIGLEWEPDGRHLVFSSDREGGINVFRVDGDGGEPVLVTGGGAKLKHPSVARTGAIAYENWHYDINIDDVSLGDGARRAISPTTDQWNFHPQISPDGSRIAFQSTRSGHYEIWVAGRDGSNPVAVTASGGYKSPPRWSPDGRSLVFVSRPAGLATLVLADATTHETRTLLTEPDGIAAPSFAGDGSGIYFGSARTGSWQTWLVGLAGGAPRQLTTDGGYAVLESPDRQWLYFSRFDRRGLWRRPRRGGPEQLISSDVAPEDWPNWGVLDRGLYFIARPDDDDPVLMVAEGDRPPRPVTRLVDHAWSGVAMSRDGSHVFYAHADHRDANIVGIEFVR